jgi:predicted negative regulator of RcsB-dependent stress response
VAAARLFWCRLMKESAATNRSATASGGASDDPIEQVTDWVQANQRPLLYGVVGVALVAAGAMVYKMSQATAAANASKALYEAQAPMAEGKLPEAKVALEKVVARYGGTASGSQAVMLLAQVLYDQQQYDAGIAALTKAIGGASSEFAAPMRGLLAAGYEGKGQLKEAAAEYGKAAKASAFPADAKMYEASQARSLQGAGQVAEAKALWSRLAEAEGEAFAQEARVRLGELAGSGK